MSRTIRSISSAVDRIYLNKARGGPQGGTPRCPEFGQRLSCAYLEYSTAHIVEFRYMKQKKDQYTINSLVVLYHSLCMNIQYHQKQVGR